MVDVLHVQAHPFGKGKIAAPGDLPESGDPRPDAETAAVPVPVEAVVVTHRQGPRSHQAHVSHEHVDKVENNNY